MTSSSSIRPDPISRPRRTSGAALDVRPRAIPPTSDFDFADNLGQEIPEPRSAGLGGVVHAALGPVNLPTALHLVTALEQAADRVDRAESAVPGLANLVRAVIDEEIAKLNRYIDISGG